MTRKEFVKKRLLPIALITAIALIANDTCNKADRTHATIELDLGDARDRVRAVTAELVVDGDIVGTFRREAPAGAKLGPCRFAVALPAPDGRLTLTVDLGNGDLRELTRSIHVEEGATITVPLAADLRPR